MKVKFSKFHGTGNDFIIIDNRKGLLHLNQSKIHLLCHRRFGIGADGLILAEERSGSRLFMRYHNSDGREATMCGNGGRCLAAWAQHIKLTWNEIAFDAVDGAHRAQIQHFEVGDYFIRLTMNDVTSFNKLDDGYFVNTGSPHFVKFVPDPDIVDVNAEGSRIRFGERFKPDGVNVNFAKIGEGGVIVRTYERGVEDETLSCGTGVTAVTIATMLETGSNIEEWNITTKGGQLKVSAMKLNERFTDVILSGPATLVYEGEIDL